MNRTTSIFCAVSLILEVIGFLIVIANYQSACIQAGEITAYVHAYALLCYAVFASDLFYGIWAFFMEDDDLEDFTWYYHALAMAVSFASGISICVGLTFCGNIAQYFFVIGGVLVILAGISHAIAAIRIKKEVDDSPFS